MFKKNQCNGLDNKKFKKLMFYNYIRFNNLFLKITHLLVRIQNN